MISRRLLLAATVAMPSLARAQGKLENPAQWYAVKVEDDAFTVEMPGVPDHRIIDDATPRGTAFKLHSYSLETMDRSYLVQTAVYPSDAGTAQPRAVLQAALDARAASLTSRRWDRVEWHESEHRVSVEARGVLTSGKGLRQLAMLRGQRFISLAFLGSRESLASPDADRFFRSLKIK